jgi:hypothetical protein
MLPFEICVLCNQIPIKKLGNMPWNVENSSTMFTSMITLHSCRATKIILPNGRYVPTKTKENNIIDYK